MGLLTWNELVKKVAFLFTSRMYQKDTQIQIRRHALYSFLKYYFYRKIKDEVSPGITTT